MNNISQSYAIRLSSSSSSSDSFYFVCYEMWTVVKMEYKVSLGYFLLFRRMISSYKTFYLPFYLRMYLFLCACVTMLLMLFSPQFTYLKSLRLGVILTIVIKCLCVLEIKTVTVKCSDVLLLRSTHRINFSNQHLEYLIYYLLFQTIFSIQGRKCDTLV